MTNQTIKEGNSMTNEADVVIHINEKLDTQHREKLSKNVCNLDGVISADLKDRQPHLMIVGYDPQETKSLNILTGVRNTGMHAQLVGWL